MCAVCAVRAQAAAGFVLLQCRMCGKRLRVCEGTVTDLSTLLSVGRSLTHMPTQQQNTAAITTRWFWWVICIQRRSRTLRGRIGSWALGEQVAATVPSRSIVVVVRLWFVEVERNPFAEVEIVGVCESIEDARQTREVRIEEPKHVLRSGGRIVRARFGRLAFR